MQTTTTTALQRLVTIMDELRDKCPWDKKQTIHTLRTLTIEETYELADAITNNDYKGIKEELGDLLLHIVFYAKIGAEQNQFTLDEVIHTVCEKLIYRHPHIYSNVVANDEETVKQNWEKLKLTEGKTSVFGGVPVSLPSTVKAMRIQEKARQFGFEWDNTNDVWAKVQEELQELQEAVVSGNKVEIENEFGDVIFSLINYARFIKVDAETAVEKTNKKFMHRFMSMEKIAAAQGKSLENMTLSEMDALWTIIKKQE